MQWYGDVMATWKVISTHTVTHKDGSSPSAANQGRKESICKDSEEISLWRTQRNLLASLSDSSKHRTSPSLTGPFTFLIIARPSSRNSTRTWNKRFAKIETLCLYLTQGAIIKESDCLTPNVLSLPEWPAPDFQSGLKLSAPTENHGASQQDMLC